MKSGSDGLSDLRFPLTKGFGHVGRRLGISRQLISYVHSNRVDVIHLHGLWMLPNILPGAIAVRRSIPVIVSPHGMLGAEALRFSRRKKQLAMSLGQGYVLKSATCFRATAMSEVEEIRAMGLRQPIALVPNGIDLPVMPDSIAKGRYLLSLGRIHPKKGLADLILAWNRVAGDFPDWHLRIVGPDENGHSDELARLITRFDVQRVSILGPLFGEEKLRVMSQAEVFVMPSLNENFGIAVAESLAVGVPVISTTGAPWSELNARHCGWWVDRASDSLSGALASSMSLGGAERINMGKRGQAWMESSFNWDVLGDRMARVMDWVLGTGEQTGDIIRD